jgi:hypothetical protein
MKIIWVLDNIRERKDFYSRLHTLLLLCSVKLWKKFYPDDYCVLYCDLMTKEFLIDLKVECFWNEIILLKSKKNINKRVFWASSKLEALSYQKEPITIIDNDLLVFFPIKQFLNKDKVYFHHHEIGNGYYPTSLDKYVRQLSYRPRWQTDSVNVSLLQLPDYKFTQEYANLSLKLMEEFTSMNVPHSQYLIFAEQLLLKHLLDKNKVDYHSLISTDWNCKDWKWDKNNEKGIWTINESGRYLKHYGPEKNWIVDNKEGYDYKKEIKHLENCLNFPILDLSKIKRL